MRTVRVRAPGSCGEFIQGTTGGDPCLVSCPIDLYTTVTILEGPAQQLLGEKSARMFQLIFDTYHLPREEKHKINVSLTSEIPVARGMASSTADLSALAMGLSAYYDLGLDDGTIAKLCAAIEPTDNIMYPQLNLFDHVSGRVLKDYGTQVQTPILIVEFAGKVDTLGFHGSEEGYNAADEAAFSGILEAFNQGLDTGDLQAVGAACTASARLNQKILYKPHLEKMIALSEAHGGYGVVNGHSGTVVGVLYDESHFDYKGFMGAFVDNVPKTAYDAIFLKNVVSGGLDVSVLEC